MMRGVCHNGQRQYRARPVCAGFAISWMAMALGPYLLIKDDTKMHKDDISWKSVLFYWALFVEIPPIMYMISQVKLK